MEAIQSPRNPKVRAWRRLRRPDVARERGQVLVEGTQAVLNALSSPHRLEALLLCPAQARPETVALVTERAGGDCAVYALSPEAFSSLSEREGPAGVAGVFAFQPRGLDSATTRPDDLLLALWCVENAGNLGTIMRTADALGAAGVVLVDRCVNPYAPLAAKASVGALLTVPLYHCASLQALRAWCDGQGARLVGTSAHAPILLSDWRPSLPLVLLFGREGSGLPEDAVDLCNQMVRIAMRGVCSSLNLATAVGIVAYAALPSLDSVARLRTLGDRNAGETAVSPGGR